MLTEFKKFVKHEKLFTSTDRILLAVSGGVDSMVMIHLFHQAGLSFGIAHVNFALRGKESDMDELLVSSVAKELNIPFHVQHFDTKTYAKQYHLSIQVAARNLRYDWFHEILETEKYNFIATAHHLDDQTETFFINLIRGTGISGLHGILPKKGNIIRPLLFTTRNDIYNYAIAEKLKWNEDKSNQSRKYLRNKLRLDVIPELQQINPTFSDKLDHTIRLLRNIEDVYRTHIQYVANQLISIIGGDIYIPIDKLCTLTPLNTYLYELLQPYNFTSSVVNNLANSLHSSTGKMFLSSSHKIIVDRNHIIIQTLQPINIEPQEILIQRDSTHIKDPIALTFEISKPAKTTNYRDNNTAYLDLDKLIFPLKIRKWQRGDRFIPFGMNGEKKLSDFFIDNKISLPNKENIYLLLSGNNIVWVIGMRIDERYKITDKTNNILIVRLSNNKKTIKSG